MSHAMALSQLLPDLPGVPDGLMIGGLVLDTRELRAGDAFVAIAPAAHNPTGDHGLRFAGQALASGASVVLYEPPAPAGVSLPAGAIAVPGLCARLGEMAARFHRNVTEEMTVVGVTGTNGKTSIAQLLAQAWHLRGVTSGTIGTLGAGLYGQAVATGFTTPLVLRLHELLAGLHHAGARAIAMEVSSHALDQGRVDGVHFDVALFTNLSRDHLDYHGDMEGYGAAKTRLFHWPGLKAAVINLDDDFGSKLAATLPSSLHVIGLSSRGRCDALLRAERVRLDGNGIAFDLVLQGPSAADVHPVRSPLLGRFNVDNLLAVAGAMHALGDAPAQIADTLSLLKPVHGRMNRLGGEQSQPLVVVDYAHTPDALEQALTSLRAHAPAKLVCVFGCGGERDRGKRPQMAAIAEARADEIIVTDDNPRRESGDAIVAEIVAGLSHPERAIVIRDRAAAIARAIGQAGPDDIVLIAGKGHESYQEINGVQHPFDDTAVARHCLELRP